MKLEDKQIGVFAALIIATIMLFLPDQDNTKYSFNPEVLASTILEKSDQVSPDELSQWIIEGRNDYQLIDIRSEKMFSKGHIKGAENIPLPVLLQKQTVYQDLSDNKLIVLYSNGNSHAHQAWLVLKTAGIDCYVLEGGFNYWNSMLLNPTMPKNFSDDEILRYKTAQSVSAYFGGTGKINEAKDVDTGNKPKRTIKRKKRKKKLDGC